MSRETRSIGLGRRWGIEIPNRLDNLARRGYAVSIPDQRLETEEQLFRREVMTGSVESWLTIQEQEATNQGK